MRNNLLLFSGLVLIFITSCTPSKSHFISDAGQLSQITSDFDQKKATIGQPELFGIFDSALSQEEREAMQFLYAYMPLSDITDYSGTYHLANIRQAFKAKQELPWGANIPEREFNHFVVPARVNNENLDDFRTAYYDELKQRVEGLSLGDAVLEINHWCHEHVNYKGSDSRTSSPMATVKTSWGRCGEESTLLVAALRTVCIPARQVYTPRWAHCDDNHAWVEAYVDGTWHFLGACEPEPVLDLGWFNAPASRCLLLHTRVFGRYFGPEEVIERTANHTEINVVSNYAETSKAYVKVTDANGQAKNDIRVDFKIYNYSEFCTVASKTTDENGVTWLTAGLGDMMAYAADNGKFGFDMIRFGQTDTVRIVLDKDEQFVQTLTFDIVPPVEKARMPEVSAQQRAENDRRFAVEDSIRNAYIAFCQQQQQVETTDEALKGIMAKTFGNYQTIKDFVKQAQDKGEYEKAIALLSNVSDKDLRDISLDVLNDHLDNTPHQDNALFDRYILSPRVSNEMLCPYKKTLSTAFDTDQAMAFKAKPQLLVNWVTENIEVRNDLNVRSFPMLPTSVLKSKVTDRHSRDLFFVAVARSLGIAAQKDPVTGTILYHDGQQWLKADFGETQPTTRAMGTLKLSYQTNASIPDPRYYTHFSIKKFDGTRFNLLSYDAKDPGMDVGMSYSEFAGGIPLETGYYVLASGTRLADGSVLNRTTFFNIEEGQTTEVELVLREPETGVKIIGNFNAENRFTNIENDENQSLLQIAGRNFYVLGLLDQGSEPTTHAMQDIAAVQQDFNASGLHLFFIFNDKDTYDKFQLKKFEKLPEGITYGINKGLMLDEIKNNMHLDKPTLPVFIIANSNNEVVFVSQGYTIGLGEQLINVIKKL